MTSELRAVLWDLDGTIVDSEPLWLQAETEMLQRYGLELDEATRERLIGIGLWDGARLFQELGVPLAADDIVHEWSSRVTELYSEREPQWRPGACELLQQVREAGIINVLVTMSTHSIAAESVAQLPEGTFAALVTGDRVPLPKPHPEPYLLGAAAAGVQIHECVALEDSPTGLRAAASSGAVAVAVENELRLSKENAHVLLDTLSGVDLSLIRTWHGKYQARTPREGGYEDRRSSATQEP